MRLEPLTRLIESSDFSSFREIAIRVLSLRGFVAPSLSDGPGDGAQDVWVTQLPPNPTPFAIQLSVEKRWPAKLRIDAGKAKTTLHVQDMLFVSSRRIPETDFQKVSADIFRELDLRVTRIDSQGIATTLLENDQTAYVFHALGIQITLPPTITGDASSARSEAAYSFVVFGAEPQRFRQRMIEAAIIMVAARAAGELSRSAIANDVCRILNVSGDRVSPVGAAIDRMIQRGDLSSPRPSILSLDPQLRDTAVAIHSLREREWQDMERELADALSALLPKTKVATLLPIIRDDLGALLISSANRTVQTLERSERRGLAEDTIRRQLRRLHATLDTQGVPVGDVRTDVLQTIAETVEASSIGKHIVAAEVYSALSTLQTPHLIRAMGAESEIEVYLDASVAIPILANLMYQPGRQHRYFVAADHVYGQLRTLRLPILLPADYLEEVASHLYLAFQDYSVIVDIDTDLVASQNAFVAHYASMRLDGARLTFPQYLAGFGFDASLQRSTLQVARDALMPILQRHFDRYKIKVTELADPSKGARKQAEEMVARAMNALGLTRPSVLQHHDAWVLAQLSDRQRDASRAVVLCTWDSMHFRILDREHPSWDVMDPAVLGDILALSARELGDSPLVSIAALSRLMTEEDARDGASVWDAIVRIERGALHNAELLAQARAFKRTYLKAQKQGLGRDDIAQAWLEWKARVGDAEKAL